MCSSDLARLKLTLLSETFVSFITLSQLSGFCPSPCKYKYFICFSPSSVFLFPSYVLLLLFQCFNVIPGLAFALFAVLDGLFGAIADARHAVGAVFAPDRLSVFQMDVVQGTQLHAPAAADAGVRCPEGIGFYKEAIEHRVHRGSIPCLDAGVQVVKQHLQPFGNAPCQIPAVAGSRKIKHHGCSFVFLWFSDACLPGKLEVI